MANQTRHPQQQVQKNQKAEGPFEDPTAVIRYHNLAHDRNVEQIDISRRRREAIEDAKPNCHPADAVETAV